MRAKELIARWGGPLLAMALVAPFAVATLVYPFGRDQGIYAYTAQRFLDGDALYRDIYVFKPPLTVFVHALALTIFGQGMLAVRLLDVAWTMATAVALLGLVRLAWRDTDDVMGSRAAGIAAAVIFAGLYHKYDYWNTCQTDGWATLPSALGLAMLFVEGPKAMRWRVGAGFAVGTAFLFKYTLGGLLPVAMVVPLVWRGLSAWRESAGVVAGFLGAVFALMAFLGVTGGLPEFLSTQLEVLLPYAGAPKAGPNWSYFWRMLYLMPKDVVQLSWVGAGLAAVWCAWLVWNGETRRRELSATVALLGWAASSTVSLVVQGKFFPYHYLSLHAPIGLLCVFGVSRLVQWVPGRGRAVMAWAGLAFAVQYFGTLDKYEAHWSLLGRSLRGEDSLVASWERGKYYNKGFSLVDNLAMAVWLREHTEPDDRVFMWGYDPLVYFLAERRLVSRFLYTFPLVAVGHEGVFDDELLAALQADPPVVFVVGSDDVTKVAMGHDLDSVATLERAGSIKGFLDDHYRPTATVGRFAVYARD